ncbi:MAG: CRISPR-associated endonuclease Cas1 [Methanocorpusculum sp.]|nr:CRISPR-associated endonuclease Cas1 [Methanocorpusculum sp.]
MRIIIDDYGIRIGKQGERFTIQQKDQIQEYAARDVTQIVLTSGSSITTDAILLAAQFDVDLLILQRNGKPISRLTPHSPSGLAATRRAQYEIAFSVKSQELAKLFITGKILNCGYLLQELGRTRQISEMIQSGKEIRGLVEHLSTSGITHQQILGIEGIAARQYFSTLTMILQKTLYSGKRTQHPAKDAFNAFLNYGYAILASEIEKQIICSGLDPSIGFLHRDRSGRPSLVYDLIEEFRQPVVDRAIVTLLSRKQLNPSSLDPVNHLSTQSRRLIYITIMDKLNKKATHNNISMPFRKIIEHQTRSIINYCESKGEYVPFTQRWH